MKNLISIGVFVAVVLWLVSVAKCETNQASASAQAEELAKQGVVSVWSAPGSVLCTPPKGSLPIVAQGIFVADRYAVASAKYFPAATNFAKDPRVCLHDGKSGAVGRLVSFDGDYGIVLIRLEGELNVGLARKSVFDANTAVIVRQFLKDYFAGWGRHVLDKPKL